MEESHTPDETSAFDAILEEEERRIARVSEPFFRRELLPLIVSDDPNTSFIPWLNVAGSWSTPIDVVDEQGQVLFRAPALVANSAMPFRQSPHNSASEIIQNASRKMEAVPRAGIEFLKKNLTPRIRPSGDRQEALRQWAYIYRRYGYDHLIDSEQEQSSDEATTNNNPDSLFDGYDEA